jgi:type I restriction-modification system DNA methylase subunit
MDAPVEFKKFHKIFRKLIQKYDTSVVFDDFMDYIINGFSLEQDLLWNMQYSYEENLLFSDMYVECVKVLNQKIVMEGLPWYDFFGTYYEAEIVNKFNKEGRKQFFTPPHVADLLAGLNTEAIREGGSCNDSAAGSGRCLLAFNKLRPGIRMIAQDLDLSCIKMCICNFLFHGIKGEVYWMNSLTNEIFGGWFVNEALHSTRGAPHVMKLDVNEVKLVRMEKQASLSSFGK